MVSIDLYTATLCGVLCIFSVSPYLHNVGTAEWSVDSYVLGIVAHGIDWYSIEVD